MHAWPKTDIDRFILARQEKEHLQPVADADRITLIRRVTFDLTGLPPTPEEIDAFVNDKSGTALGQRRRSAAGLAAFRRTLGSALARRGPLRRIDRQGTQHSLPLRLALPRLRHRLLQRRQAVRSVHRRATGRRPAARQERRRARHICDRHRLSGLGPQGGQHQEPRAVRDGRDRRSDRRDGPGAAGHDDRLRPLPRPQVRSRFPRPTTTRMAGIFHSTETLAGVAPGKKTAVDDRLVALDHRR